MEGEPESDSEGELEGKPEGDPGPSASVSKGAIAGSVVGGHYTSCVDNYDRRYMVPAEEVSEPAAAVLTTHAGDG